MLGGIGGEFVQYKSEVARGVRRQQNGRPRQNWAAIRSKHSLNNRSQRYGLLIVLGMMVLSESVCIRQSNDTT